VIIEKEQLGPKENVGEQVLLAGCYEERKN
jgi:hypothetical protein